MYLTSGIPSGLRNYTYIHVYAMDYIASLPRWLLCNIHVPFGTCCCSSRHTVSASSAFLVAKRTSTSTFSVALKPKFFLHFWSVSTLFSGSVFLESISLISVLFSPRWGATVLQSRNCEMLAMCASEHFSSSRSGVIRTYSTSSSNVGGSITGAENKGVHNMSMV